MIKINLVSSNPPLFDILKCSKLKQAILNLCFISTNLGLEKFNMKLLLVILVLRYIKNSALWLAKSGYTHLCSIGWASPGPDRSPRSCDMCLQNFKLSLLCFSRTEQISQILWHVLHCLQNFKFSDDSFAGVWDCQSFTSASTSLWMCPSNTSLFTNPQVCSDFLTLLAAWEISRISVRNRFERDVCSQVSREVSKSSIFSAIFRKRTWASWDKSFPQVNAAVLLPDSPMLVDSRMLSRSVVFYSRFLCLDLFGYSAYFYKFCRIKDIHKNERISKLMWFVCLQRSFSF